MWLLPFPWLDTTKLCSGDEGGKKVLTEWRRVTYGQKQDKSSLFINVTTVLPPSGRGGHLRRPFRGRGATSLPLRAAKTVKMARLPHNSD